MLAARHSPKHSGLWNRNISVLLQGPFDASETAGVSAKTLDRASASPKLDLEISEKITIATPWKIPPREYQPDQTVQQWLSAHKRRQRKPPSRYDNISRSQFLLSSDALVPMVQPADFPDLNDPASL